MVKFLSSSFIRELSLIGAGAFTARFAKANLLFEFHSSYIF